MIIPHTETAHGREKAEVGGWLSRSGRSRFEGVPFVALRDSWGFWNLVLSSETAQCSSVPIRAGGPGWRRLLKTSLVKGAARWRRESRRSGLARSRRSVVLYFGKHGYLADKILCDDGFWKSHDKPWRIKINALVLSPRESDRLGP